MRNTLETRLGIFFALALVVSVLLLEMVGAFEFFKGGYSISASFRNAQELKKGDLVKMAGVEIGRVEAIELTNMLARVSMKLQKKYEADIKTDSKAVVKFTGLMGQNYIEIEGGSPTSPQAQPGAALQSGEQPDLSKLMAKLEDVANGVEGLTKSFSPKTLSTLVGPLNDFIIQNSPALTATIGNIRSVSDQIAQGEGTVGQLIKNKALYNAALGAVTNFQSASADIKGLVDQAQGAVGDARQIIADIKSGQGNLGKLTKDEALYRETTNAMNNLSEILQKVNRGQGSVGKLVNDETFLKNAKMSLQKLDKATDSLEDQGPLSVLGIIIGTLF
jgi:phospholipid/cholesterol/gamma-HCH transport system substrate-binding protein